MTVFYNDTNLNHKDTFLFTKTLIFKISVIMLCFGAKKWWFKTLNFDFSVVNFDIMKRISFTKVAKSLVESHFCPKEKGTQVSYQYLRSNVVEVRGIVCIFAKDEN